MFDSTLPGLAHEDLSFDTAIPTRTLELITHDPRELENDKYLEKYPHLATLAKERERIQRAFKGEKKKNVPKYRDYMIRVNDSVKNGLPFGAIPTITLWTDQKLEVVHCEVQSSAGSLDAQFLKVPHGVKFIAIDGETQLAARFAAGECLRDQKTRVTIHYGKPLEWAIGAFVDLNTKMVSMNKELVVTKSPDDVLGQIAKHLIAEHEALYERIKENDTTIKRNEHYWMTHGKLRLFVACVWRGKPGVAIGSRPILESEFRDDDASRERLQVVCKKFWDAVHSHGQSLVKAFEDRNQTVVGTPAVIAALGAIAHDCGGGKGLVLVDETEAVDDKMRGAIASLSDVDWSRAEAWAGLCGRWVPGKEPGDQGKFRVGGGAKDGIYDVYRALTENDSKEYRMIRRPVDAVIA